jgi:hypothetical protein
MEENIFEADLVLVEADMIIEVNPISMLQLKRKYSIYPPKKISMRNFQIKKNLDINKLNLYDLNQSNWFDENLNYILIGLAVVAATIFLTQ